MSTPTHSAKYVFWYLLMMLSLLFAATGAGQVLFAAIDTWLPDPAADPYAAEATLAVLRWGLASLLVAVPVLYTTLRSTNTGIEKGELALTGGVRRWCEYIIVFFAAATALGDLVGVFFRFLEGDLPLPSVLRFLTVLVLAGGIAAYFAMDLGRTSTERTVCQRRAGILLIAVSVLVFGLGIVINSSPAAAHDTRLDSARVQQLQNISDAVDHYYTDHSSTLPATLQTLSDAKLIYPEDMRDSATNAPLGYTPEGTNTYQLCATFASAEQERASMNAPEWQHDAGHYCFDRTAHMLDTNAPRESIPAQ